MIEIEMLPDVICHEIALWSSYKDQISFASVNIRLSTFLLRRLRRIRISREEQLYWTSQTFRDQIHRLVLDPSHQLILDFYPNHSQGVSLEGFNAINCFELSTHANLFIPPLIDRINSMNSLDLCYEDQDDDEFSPPSVETICQWINHRPSVALKSLRLTFLDGYGSVDLPVIPNLESLYIYGVADLQINTFYYSHLHVLKINSCQNIEDVSCFNKIHELHLILCNKIINISCLNNNYKIIIENCRLIIDYSNSFLYSKIININYFHETKKKLNFDFSKLSHVTTLNIKVDKETLIEVFIFPPSLKLRQVYLQGINYPFTVPNTHYIQCLRISNCLQFTSLLHCDRIHSIYLYNLTMNTLEGLGSGNRVVEIRECPLITNFSQLSHCDKVVIHKCEGFQDMTPLRGLKDFTFSPYSPSSGLGRRYLFIT